MFLLLLFLLLFLLLLLLLLRLLMRLLLLLHESRQRDLHAYFGLEEGVGEGDGVHALQLGVLSEFWVQVEEHWHVHLSHTTQHKILHEAQGNSGTHMYFCVKWRTYSHFVAKSTTENVTCTRTSV
jgi:hypothetical protein